MVLTWTPSSTPEGRRRGHIRQNLVQTGPNSNWLNVLRARVRESSPPPLRAAAATASQKDATTS